MTDRPVTIDAVARTLATRARPGEPLLVGVTGSVAAGKTTLCRQLAGALAPLTVETVSTDGFLLPNAVLEPLGLLPRKGWPETYDAGGLLTALARLREGPAVVPGYSHRIYDIDPALSRTVARADVLLVEGLGLSGFPDGRHAADALDVLIYLDADEDDLERWYVDRFTAFWRAAETDPASFYARFRTLDLDGVTALARRVWTEVNLPNVRESVVPARDRADILLRKAGDHSLVAVRGL